jgi:uncharacterized membrane protein YdbT with pleckstrin-like domain
VELLEGETVLWHGRPSWRSMVAFYIKWGLIALIPGVVAQIISTEGGVNARTTTFWPITVVLLLIVLLVGWIIRFGTRYIVTDQRIYIRRGILTRHERSTHRDRIQNVNTDQGFFQRLLSVGNVDFDTAGGDDFNFVFVGINDPGNLVRLVSHRPEAAAPAAAATDTTFSQGL